nr:hypothetical protein [Parasphingorhabdus cellanae]
MANGDGAVALGNGSAANGNGAVAIGPNAVADHDNLIALGGEAATVKIAGITSSASQAAQQGPLSLITTDAQGNLGAMNIDVRGLLSVGNRIMALEGQVTKLFDLAKIERRETNRGIVAAIALTTAPFPSAPGKTSYTANGAA